jgi:hypothetical protein
MFIIFKKNTDSMLAPFQGFIFKENTIRRALPYANAGCPVGAKICSIVQHKNRVHRAIFRLENN